MIASYLAIKYGLPFDQNLMSTSGDTLWSQAALKQYSNGVAGIGRDDTVGLLQTISKASGSEHILSVRKPSRLSADLQLPAFNEDQQFVIWGHDGKAVSIIDPTPLLDAAYRMERTWLIQEKGDIDSLQVVIPAETRAEYVLMDASGAFDAPEIVELVYSEDAENLVAYLDIDRTTYFTFAASTPYEGYGTPPAEFVLYQNYPNPFNPTTTIRFDLPQDAHVYLDVYDILGRRVRLLVDEEMTSGSHSVSFDGSGLASGVYFYRMKANSEVRTQKMLLAK